MLVRSLMLAIVVLVACGDDSSTADSGRDSGLDAPGTDVIEVDAGADVGADIVFVDVGVDSDGDSGTEDAGGNCLEDGFEAGERYALSDRCNFCECQEDGSTVCTERTCLDSSFGGCEYMGVMHDYGERFPSSDDCNECVCAASGLACTRRTEACPATPDEGAILLDSLTDECGVEDFSPQVVLDTLPHSELVLPFVYNRGGRPYPESLPDTEVTLRIVRDQTGYAVCRIPRVGQEAIDLEVLIEWFTEDGAFDETFHAYLRRNAGGFTDVWTVAASVEPGELNGTYTPGCPLFDGFGFNATIDADTSAVGGVAKVCAGDISLSVGSFEFTP